MAKQRGSKPRAVLGIHHGLMHGPQSHPHHFYRQRNSLNNSPNGSTKSNFSAFMNNIHLSSFATPSSSSPKTSSSSNLSPLFGRVPYKVSFILSMCHEISTFISKFPSI